MSLSHFIRLLVFTLAFLLLTLIPLHFVDVIRPFIDLSIILTLFFILLSFGVYYLGERFVRSKNKYLYNQLILINFAVKLGLSIGILFVYHRITDPDSNLFIVPFGIIYLAFTILEAVFMSTQSRISE